MKSVKENPQVIDEYLVRECSLGCILGPLNPTIIPEVHISCFGVMPKKHAQNEWRMILDLSSPEGSSVNDGVDPALCSLTYPSVRDTIAEIARLRKGALLAKVDVKSAFRIVPVHPEDTLFLGMKWRLVIPPFCLACDLLQKSSTAWLILLNGCLGKEVYPLSFTT